MLLSVLTHTHSLRWMIPATIMLGSSPTFFTIWSGWRVLTALLPLRFYVYGDDRLYSLYQRLILYFFHTYTATKVELYGDVACLHSKRENVIFICNHQCTVDWIIADMLASAQGSVGSIRYILKDGLKFFPLYGFYFRQHSCIYVKRSGKFVQEKTQMQVDELKQNNIPIWLVIFPEGTRFNPELSTVIEKSKKFCREQGFEELEYVLAPKLKAFQLALSQLQGHAEAVYDVTIAYGNTTDHTKGERIPAPGMPEYLMEKSPHIHVHLERIPLSEIPQEQVQLQNWMFKRFQLKDRLLSHFYSKNPEETERFPGEHEQLVIKRRQTLPAFIFFGTCLGLLLGTSQGRSFYWKVGVFGTLGGCLWMSFSS